MKAEIIAVGTELLLGQIVNTNAQYLAQQCAAMGIDGYFQTVVGDNEARLKQAISLAKDRAELIIFTGGLGPTLDDLTKDVLAAFLQRELIMHQPSMDRITAFFEARGIAMVESNARQALMIAGSDALLNDTGMAVGNAMTLDGTHYVLLPGPPREMKPMFENYAKDWLRTVMRDEMPLYSTMLKFCGIGESSLEHALLDLIESQQDPTIAPYAKEGEVTIRLSTKAHSQEAANLQMASTVQMIRDRLGLYLYAQEDIGIEQAVLRLLAEKNATLAVAESCTGGLLSDLITSISGSSTSFLGGIICYSNQVKHELLRVPTTMLEGEGAPGAVSAETAQVLAEQLLILMKSDYAISITGVAGPNPSEGKPVGLVYIGVAQKGQPTLVVNVTHSGGRDLIKLKSAKTALYHLWKRLVE
ncbi:competence/damage-inducible protein A [Paenibacillus psychroresistens]|uniref:Putative competence-damage inducible protein n=1 Tax=Paenibacillus psychroresistens TaxID=1778678 RepID=A0A6B8RIM5_9BACL|nr:competence/damage-inducible protein A [Paenibacillus psychroresistens]QGQ96301.1 competence/damage-inducible protein A [Paenibacillus psychroresistens]